MVEFGRSSPIVSRPILISPEEENNARDIRMVASWGGHIQRRADDDCPNAPTIGSMTVPSRLATAMPFLELPSPASVSDDTISLVMLGEATKRFAASAPVHGGNYMAKVRAHAHRPSALSILNSEAFREDIVASLESESAIYKYQGRSRAPRGSSSSSCDREAAVAKYISSRSNTADDDNFDDNDEDDDGLFALES